MIGDAKVMNEARGEPIGRSQVKNTSGGLRAHESECSLTTETDAYRLEPHICRVCHTRLVSRPTQDGRHYECPNCGVHAVGHDASVLCCCGMKVRRPLKGGGSGHSLVDAGIRCMPNPSPTPDFPSLYIASEA